MRKEKINEYVYVFNSEETRLIKSCLDYCYHRIESHDKKININEENVGDINKISGVSATLARNIVRFRKTRGRFKNWRQLLRVPGMNRRILENMKKVGTLK